jgi:hypothetical protein
MKYPDDERESPDYWRGHRDGSRQIVRAMLKATDKDGGAHPFNRPDARELLTKILELLTFIDATFK